MTHWADKRWSDCNFTEKIKTALLLAGDRKSVV